MNRRTKSLLVAAIVAAMIVVIAVWYRALPAQRWGVMGGLTAIEYRPAPPPSGKCSPACSPPDYCVGGLCHVSQPTFTFRFASPVDAAAIAGSSAILKSFTLASPTPETQRFVDALACAGAQCEAGGGMPFPPRLAGPAVIVSDEVPAKIANDFRAPLTLQGAGEMWFAYPVGA